MAISFVSRSVIVVFSVVVTNNFHFVSVCFIFKEEKTSSYLLPREYSIYRF